MIKNLARTKRKWLKRKKSIRKRVMGSAHRPRMTVFRSLRHTYVQVIDDASGRTLAAASTQDKSLREEAGKMKKADAATQVGTLVAERCLEKNIDRVVFDRNGYAFSGRVAKVADAARKKGLSF